jgi:hypothetical protein
MTLPIRKIAISLFLTVLTLSLTPFLRAQTSLDQQKRTARVLSTGALDGVPGWLSLSTHTPGSGVYTVNFTTPFTEIPNCQVTAESVNGVAVYWATILSPSLNAAQSLSSIKIFTVTPGVLGVGVSAADAAFRISCVPDQIIATSTATWDQNGNLVTNPNNWVSIVNHLGSGYFQAVFAKPYVVPPSCTASPSFPTFANSGATLDIGAVTTTSVTVSTQGFNTATVFLGPIDIPVYINCVGQQ